MIKILDFEVTRFDWLVCILDPYKGEFTDIVNDPQALRNYYDEHSGDIFVGYNIRHYDQYIFKGILCGFNPWDVSDWIIGQHNDGWQYSGHFNKIELLTYDVMKLNDGGLKSLEGYMGNDIRETTVSFDIDRPMTDDEIEQMLFYCHSDVNNTCEVFLERKADFDAQMGLITEFKLPMTCISKTQAQICAKILNCNRKEHDDEFDVRIAPTIQLSKYAWIKDWFIRQLARSKEAGEYIKEPLNVVIGGTPCVLAWGGGHGAIPKYHVDRRSGRLLVHVDVQSYYPSLIITYGYYSRNSTTPEVYKGIYEKRLALKAAGKKKEQAPLKVVLNGGGFGICKDKNSQAYDPQQANNICITGQLMLIDLMEKLESAFGDDIKFPNVNTDGLIVEIPDNDKAWETLDDVCYEWEHRTGMTLEFDVIEWIFQKDVNNYCFKFDGKDKIERKGGMLQESNRLKNDLTILNTALVEYFVHRTPVEKTIMECEDISLFQKVVKVSNKYEYGVHNGEILNDKTFRVYASLDESNDSIYKHKADKPVGNDDKFGNTPDHIIIYNNCLTGVTPADIGLDKQWYIDLAYKRLAAFGVDVL